MNLDRNTRTINFLSIVLVFLIASVDYFYRQRGYFPKSISIAKNGLLFMSVFIFSYELVVVRHINKHYKKIIFKDETLDIILLSLSFLVLSINCIIKNRGFYFNTLDGLARIAIPVLVSFTILNVMNIQEIYRLMQCLLIIMFTSYIFSISDKISIENFLSIDIVNSYSPFESHFYCTVSIAFSMFFGYYKEKRSMEILSNIFVFLTGKRYLIVFSFLILVFGSKMRAKKDVDKIWVYILMISLLAISFVYINMMMGIFPDYLQIILGKSVDRFTMGRSYFMRNILQGGFVSYGFRSSDIQFRGMEMDIPAVYVEMGIPAVIVTIYFIIKISKRNAYNLFLSSCCLIELLVAQWFQVVYFWIITYITIGCVAYKEDLVIKDLKIKIKILPDKNLTFLRTPESKYKLKEGFYDK